MAKTFDEGANFEERLIHALIVDHRFAAQMVGVLKLEFFSLLHLRKIAQGIFDYHRTHQSFPSFQFCKDILFKSADDLCRQKIERFFTATFPSFPQGEVPFIQASALEFCKKQSLLSALEKAVYLADAMKFDEILGLVQNALTAGSVANLGHEYETSLKERLIDELRVPIPTPWPMVNKITKGGLSAGEFGVIMAPTGVGKTHALVEIAAAAAKDGKTVCYCHYEMTSVSIGKRIDAAISGIRFDDLHLHENVVQQHLDALPGKIRIKRFKASETTAGTIRNHIAQLKMAGIFPDLLIVDYADIMKSSAKYDSRRAEEESIYVELHDLAEELHIPIWSASQSNRASLDVEVITLQHISECFAKSQTTDIFITMNRKQTGEEITFGNFFIAKNRLGPSGIKLNIQVDTAKSQILVYEPGSHLEQRMLLENDLAFDSEQARVRKKMQAIRKRQNGQEINI